MVHILVLQNFPCVVVDESLLSASNARLKKKKNINIFLSVKLVDLSKMEEVEFKASSHESVNEEASKMSIDTFYVKWNKHLLFSNIEARNLLIIMLHTSKHFRSDYINGMMIK